jgi:hypothetical protein
MVSKDDHFLSMELKRLLFSVLGLFAVTFAAFAQNGVISVRLIDSSTSEAVGFATISISKEGSDKPFKYALTSSEGKAKIENVPAGKYTFKAELLGYKNLTKKIEVKGNLDLGDLKMDLDRQALDQATVSAAGNPITVKKDTIEYNASSFKTTENAVLEDLLKKLPGVEISEDGTITANGETISKITIDGKTFFLDDPQLASKNLPAKIIDKVKVVQKKSEQAEFTGIDDGNDETVIDLTIQKGMMNGLFGNISGGVGHDWTSGSSSSFGSNDGDWRYQGGAFIGNFSDKRQISIILNGNNTNNRGFNDLSGGMMQGMRGGGGGMGRGSGGFGGSNGITTSWMGGLNGNWTLFDDKMELGGNYLYSGNKSSVEEQSVKDTYLEDSTTLTYRNGVKGPGYSNNNSYGHRFGIRLEHKFSENTSIIFQPQVNFGTGNYHEFSDFETVRTESDGSSYMTNEGFNNNSGDNSNWTTNGFLLFRQRLGIPGRTISFMGNYSFSHNELDGFNQSLTRTFNSGDTLDDIVNQRIDQLANSASLSGRLVYTEPIGNGFYVEGHYSYSWSRNKSEKDTYNSGDNSAFSMDNPLYVAAGETLDDTYSNNIVNRYVTQEIGVNLQYQQDKLHAQVGANLIPTNTHNETNGKTYKSNVLNWSPSAMMWYDINDNTNARLFYFGRSSQPTTSQLMPVPDNTDPLNVSLGNPYLDPYFNHDIRAEFRTTNKETFLSFNARISGGIVKDPIVSAVWYDPDGVQYSIPVNGPNSENVSARFFLNTPIAKSNFSIFLMSNTSYSNGTSYIASTTFDMSPYDTDGDGVFDDYEKFHEDYSADIGNSSVFSENKTQTLGLTERLRLTYRNDFVDIEIGGRTRMNRSWYTVNSSNNKTTWNNQLDGEMTWTIPGGIEASASCDYNWYRGYSTPQDDEFILNAEINKLLFKKRLTIAIRGYDLLNQSKNLSVTDASNYHQEALNNTLGRYVVFVLTYRFGNFGGQRGNMRGGPGGGPGRGGPGGPPR